MSDNGRFAGLRKDFLPRETPKAAENSNSPSSAGCDAGPVWVAQSRLPSGKVIYFAAGQDVFDEEYPQFTTELKQALHCSTSALACEQVRNWHLEFDFVVKEYHL